MDTGRTRGPRRKHSPLRMTRVFLTQVFPISSGNNTDTCGSRCDEQWVETYDDDCQGSFFPSDALSFLGT